jgi:hypothetical protein
MSTSKRARVVTAQPTGHGEDENCPASAEELEFIFVSDAVEDAVSIICGCKVLSCRKRGNLGIRLIVQASAARKYSIDIRALGDD